LKGYKWNWNMWQNKDELVNSDIQIGIPCSPVLFPYLEFLVQTIVKTVSDQRRIRLLMGITNATDLTPFESLTRYGVEVNAIALKDKSEINQRHGNMLNELFRHMCHNRKADKSMKLTRYGMFLDCDAAFLSKTWDSMMSFKIRGDVAIVG